MKRNTKKEKKKENKKYPYKKYRKNKKGSLGDIFGAIGLLMIGFFLGFLFGDKIIHLITEWIGGLFTNGLR